MTGGRRIRPHALWVAGRSSEGLGSSTFPAVAAF
jgi:hypothetical protein